MTDVANTESAEIDRPTAWRAAVRHSLAHAREDLARSRTAEVILARHALPSTGMEFLDELERDAAAQSFVCARAAVFAGKAFDTFEGLVRAVGRSVRAPGHAGEGVANLLAVFAAQHKRDGLAVFDRGAADFHAAGDLISLARAFLDSKRQPARELARIEVGRGSSHTAFLDSGDTAFVACSVSDHVACVDLAACSGETRLRLDTPG